MSSAPSGLVPRQGLVTLTHVIYALHAIIAVILNYVKRSEVRGSWLDTHFSWQIRTFWYALLWLVIGAVLFATVVGIPLAVVLWIATGIWVLYRIIRGWLALIAQKTLPA